MLLHILGHPSCIGAVGHGSVAYEIDLLIPDLYAFDVSKKIPNRRHLMEENDQISLDKCQCIINELCRAASGESTC